MGHPVLQVVDGNFRNRTELLVRHVHEGADLDLEEGRDALRNLQRIWRRPVNMETVVDDQIKLMTFDGSKHSEEDLSSSAA
jgi:stage V sporulation protein R